MSFLMRGTGSGKKFILLCWAGPCSITALIHCLLVGTVALSAAADVRVPVVSPCLHTPTQEILQNWQVALLQFPVGSLLLPSGSWYM